MSCRCLRPSKISYAKILTVFSAKRLYYKRWKKSSPPEHTSMTKKSSLRDWKAQWSFIKNGWSNFSITRRSLRIIFNLFCVLIRSFGMTLIAYRRPVSFLRHRNTLLKPPIPITFIFSKSSIHTYLLRQILIPGTKFSSKKRKEMINRGLKKRARF